MPRINRTVRSTDESFVQWVRKTSSLLQILGVVAFVVAQFLILEPWFGVPVLLVLGLLGLTPILFAGSIVVSD
jgi:hypothetical protein